MRTATEMWEQERDKERALNSDVHLIEYQISLEAQMLCVRLENDPRIERMKQLLAERDEKFSAYVQQLPRTTEAMQVAFAAPALEGSDVH